MGSKSGSRLVRGRQLRAVVLHADVARTKRGSRRGGRKGGRREGGEVLRVRNFWMRA